MTLPADEDYPFAIIANCYPHPSFDSTLCRDAPLTLLVLHSTSFHKEALEPMLTDLFSLTTDQRNIREAWVVECPNHGESAVRNQEALGKPQNVRYCEHCMLSFKWREDYGANGFNLFVIQSRVRDTQRRRKGCSWLMWKVARKHVFDRTKLSE